jgi:hypothetical protein
MILRLSKQPQMPSKQMQMLEKHAQMPSKQRQLMLML